MSAVTAESSARTEVHKKVGVGKADGVGEAGEGQGQSLPTLEPVPSLAGCHLTPDEAWGFSECTFLQEPDGLHKGEAGAGALYVKLWSLQSGTPASLAWVRP